MAKANKPIPKTTKGKGKNFLPVSQGGGMTEAGRKLYNKLNDANLKAPAPNPKTEADKKRKDSFCARSIGWTGERGRAARSRWQC